MKTNWWKNFFHGVALDFWRAAISDEQTRAEADFIQKHLLLTDAASVLDVPCGNGRLAIELAGRGFALAGVDIAKEFIEEAKKKSDERDLEIDWQNREMRDLQWSAEFDGAFCFGNSFGYLDDDGNVDFLTALAKTLRPGARFVIDAPAISECILPTFQVHRSIELAGITLVIDSRYDHEQGRTFTEYSFIRNGQTERRPASQRIYSYRELTRLLSEAGFENCVAYGSLDEVPFKLGAQRLLVVCQKQG